MKLKAIITAAAAAAGLAVTPALSASAAVSAPLPCKASVSNTRPVDYTTTDVYVATARYARVTTTAHYRTVATSHAVTASFMGRATVPYYISGATPGFRVVVDVTVKLGDQAGSCSAAFIPLPRY